MIKQFLIAFFLTILSVYFTFAQTNNTDSLIEKLETRINTNEKVNILLILSESFRAQNKFQESIDYAEQGLKLLKHLKTKNKIKEQFLKITAESYFLLSDFENSLNYYNRLYKYAGINNSEDFIAYAHIGFLKNYWQQGLYEKAAEEGIKAIKIFESLKDPKNANIAKLNLALIYLDIKNYKTSEKIFDDLLKVKSNYKDTFFIANIYEKKGVIKYYKSYFPYARKYYQKAYDLYRIKGDELSAAVELGNIAETYEKEKSCLKAIKLYKQAIQIEKKYQYYSGMIFLYEALGRSYSKIKRYSEAKNSYKQALFYIKKTGEHRELPNIYNMLHNLYAETGNYKKAYFYALRNMQIKDSITGENVKTKINSIRIKYETEKTEIENQKLKSEQENQKKKNTEQFFIIVIISVSFLFILIFSVLLFRYNIKNKKIKHILAEKNTKLNEAYSNIKKSIDYAGKVQNAMLSSYTETLKILSEFIILYKPAYTLSGDFYWSKKINDTVFVAVGDSTGHGISGALLSITGMSFLNEIVTEDYIQTDVILNNLRSKIKHRLNQKGDFYEQKDGWDISIFSLNLKTLQGQFSGAFNSLYTISEKNNKKTITKYKADRQPAGIYYHEKPFKHQNFKIQKGDIIWMFTDGFPDQYNDDGNKKYSSKRFKELLVSISDKEISEQKNILNSEFTKWKGNFEQVDDVLIMGIKI